MKQHSEIIAGVAGVLLPFTILFGSYIILSGAYSVGGAFQGGSVLSVAFMLRWLIHPTRDIQAQILQTAEKGIMLGLLLLTMGIIGRSMNMGVMWGQFWMMFLNVLIGIKVGCGLSIIFFRFIFHEGR